MERGIISAEQLEEALETQTKEGGLIGEIIVRLNFTTEDKIAQCLSFQYGFPYLPLENYEISEEVTKLIPHSVALHYLIIPLDMICNTLTVAMSNPLNTEAIEDLEELTKLDIQIFISTSSDIKDAIKRSYRSP